MYTWLPSRVEAPLEALFCNVQQVELHFSHLIPDSQFILLCIFFNGSSTLLKEEFCAQVLLVISRKKMFFHLELHFVPCICWWLVGPIKLVFDATPSQASWSFFVLCKMYLFLFRHGVPSK